MNIPFHFIIRRGLVFGLMGLLATGGSLATTVVPPQFDEMVNRSDFVVRARVISTETVLRKSASRRKIFTRVTLEVLEEIAGKPPEPLVLQFLGGRVGTEELVVGGMPRLRVGQESILFIKDNGRSLCPIYAMGYGFFPVAEEAVTKRRYMTRGDKMPLEAVVEVSQPLKEGRVVDVRRLREKRVRAYTPTDFAKEIKSAIKP